MYINVVILFVKYTTCIATGFKITQILFDKELRAYGVKYLLKEKVS